MIRYPIASEDLLALINARNATWISRAEARTKDYAATGDYTGGTEFWGQIKQVYITLQHEKCAYCETKLQGAMLASKVHEVEHYRPTARSNTGRIFRTPGHSARTAKRAITCWRITRTTMPSPAPAAIRP